MKTYRFAKGMPNRLDSDHIPMLLAEIMPTILRRGSAHIVTTDRVMDRQTSKGGRTFLGAYMNVCSSVCFSLAAVMYALTF